MSEKIYDGALQQDLQQQEAKDAEQHGTHPLGTELIKRFAKEVLQLIKEGLLRDGMVRIHNFGTFRLKMSKARTGYNPRTREKIAIPPRARVMFAPAKALRDTIEPNPDPITPIADKEPALTRPEPPKTDNPIAVIIPPHANVDVDIHSEPDHEQDIIAGATFASLSQPNKQNEPSLGASFPMDTPIRSSGLRNDSSPDNESDTPKQGLYNKGSHSSDNDQQTPNYDHLFRDTPDETVTVTDDSEQTHSKPESTENPYAINIDSQKETTEHAYFDSHHTLEQHPEITEKNAEPLNSESETEYLIQQNNYITPSHNKTNWPAITGVSVAILLLLVILLYWLLPGEETLPPQSNAIVQAPQTKPKVVESTSVTEPLDTAVDDVINTVSETQTIIENSNDIVDTVTEDNPSLETELASNNPETIRNDATAPSNETGDTREPAYSASNPFFAATEHKVIFGDNLWKLASHNYLNPFLWPHIYQSNNRVIRNPNILKVNSLLTLPTLEGHPSELSQTDRRSIAEGYWLLYQHYKKTGQANAHYALIGVKWFDSDVLDTHMDEILLDDQKKLNAKRSDNRMLERAMMFGS